MKSLIIAEKPSLARAVIGAIGKMDKKNGFYENDKYIVSYALGHLLVLLEIDDYFKRKKTSWNIDELPVIPDKYKFKVANDPGVIKQFKILKELLQRKDVDTVINCGDADREGQVIIDNILKACSCNKTVKRLWLPEQTADSIREQLQIMKNNEEYQSLYNEGACRTYMDWVLGINLTRLISLKKGSVFPVGRVIIPIVKYIYDRDMKIKYFKEEKYLRPISQCSKDSVLYNLELNEVKFELGDKDKAENFIKELNKNKGVVSSVINKDVKKKPPKLFSLSKAQIFISKNYKIPMVESLAIIQGLYEKGYLTYPRTNTEFLANAEKDKVKEIISVLKNEDIPIEFKDSKSIFDDSKIESHSALIITKKANAEKDKVKEIISVLKNEDIPIEFKDSKSIFDDSKIESHSALIITKKIPGENELSQKEAIVYNSIKNRFISNFLKTDTIISETEINIKVGDYNFKLKGETIKEKGFYEYEPIKEKKSLLPSLTKGEVIDLNFKLVEKVTSPPKSITDEMLSNYLKNPYKNSKTTEEEEYKAMLDGIEIGTEATRTNIIENAKKYGYISEKKGVFSIEEKGIMLIETLELLKINLYADKTVEFSKILKDVYKGNKSVKEGLSVVENELRTIVDNSKIIAIDKVEIEKKVKVEIGKCPRCNGSIYENNKGFYCENFKGNPPCNFIMWKEDKFFKDKGKVITTSIAKNLLKGKAKVKGFKKKNGDGKYDAYVVLKDTGKYINYELKFQ